MGARSGRDHNANRAVAGNYTVTPTVTDDERDELHLAVVIKELVVVGFDEQTRTGKAEAWSITPPTSPLTGLRYGARPSRLSDAHAELAPAFGISSADGMLRLRSLNARLGCSELTFVAY